MSNLPAKVAPRTLVLEGDPEQQLDYAQKAARALMKRVEAKEKKVKIGGKTYLEYGDWQTLGRFFGATAGTEWVRPIERKGAIVGYEARAFVFQHGDTISAAEASCFREERNWRNRDEYAIKSMAQTRAAAKALRNAFGWVAELAGYASTPAEEMERENPHVTQPSDLVDVPADDDPDRVPPPLRPIAELPKMQQRPVAEAIVRNINALDNLEKALLWKNLPETSERFWQVREVWRETYQGRLKARLNELRADRIMEARKMAAESAVEIVGSGLDSGEQVIWEDGPGAT